MSALNNCSQMQNSKQMPWFSSLIQLQTPFPFCAINFHNPKVFSPVTPLRLNQAAPQPLCIISNPHISKYSP
ncbi:hypothetical protein CJ030_MR2G004485 [Morella rubra]|uniref:Uncharacterized protein n=1 Tax=Morella rubra TaxID=262757 RepID=A0A6A1WJI2_9ROSI|nr:hypothetical protein CJ030_MR2G004485 [Morella rubra]